METTLTQTPAPDAPSTHNPVPIAAPLLTLAEMEARNPDAFKFDDIASSLSPQQEEEPVTLAQMMGEDDAEWVREGLKFVPRPLKIRQQRQLLKLGKKAQNTGDETDEEAAFDVVLEMATVVLQIVSPDGSKRTPTIDEIEDSFEMFELQKVIERMTGMTRSTDPK